LKTVMIMVGKTTDKLFSESIDDYVDRISHYMPFNKVAIPDLKNTRNISQENQKTLEGEQILKLIQPSDYVTLLDEHGSQFTSVQFSSWLQKTQMAAHRLVFIIGGPYGFSQNLYKRSNFMISLSPMTFSHQMVRLIFAEQLYRACTIIKGEHYHHE
jgi:23S rRNA (pseudouridine1915-N3)-methyltransferase